MKLKLLINSSTCHKSIQNPFGRCGLTLDWFTTRAIVIDFAIHQLSGPLISTMQLQKFFDPILWLQACQCLCTRRKFAHKQFPFPLIQSITQSTQFHPSLNTKIYTFDLLPFHSSLQIHISLWTLGWVGLLRKVRAFYATFIIAIELWKCSSKLNSI